MSAASETMRAYRVVWLIVCAAFGVVGVSVAFYAAPYNLGVLSLECGVSAGIWSLLVVRYRERSRRSRARFVLLASLAGGAAGGAFVGLAVVLGPGVIVLAIALVGTSPVVVKAAARALRAAWASSGGHIEYAGSALAYTGLGFVPIPRGDDLSLLTDDQLCEAWRSSTAALRGGSTHRVNCIVERRQRYLDEFERRNPKGLNVWLASTDTAGCDPGVYLIERWIDLPGADWDELTRGQGA
jgi:hypothetical protein